MIDDVKYRAYNFIHEAQGRKMLTVKVGKPLDGNVGYKYLTKDIPVTCNNVQHITIKLYDSDPPKYETLKFFPGRSHNELYVVKSSQVNSFWNGLIRAGFRPWEKE